MSNSILKLEINDKFVTEPVELYGGSQRGPMLIKPWVNWSNWIGSKKCIQNITRAVRIVNGLI